MSAEEIVTKLSEAVEKAFGGDDFPNSDDWSFDGAETRWLMSRDVPVVNFSVGDRQLCFIVESTNPENKEFYRRTASYDVSYFSEDVADEEQESVWERDRAMIEGFMAWIEKWDAAEA